jgi:anaerobic magnesium-protoporphyrin IX monomethyl ester cyclase
VKVLLVRPPRRIWPFTSQSSGFWPPLGLASLAAAARRSLNGLDVRILDCPGERAGWRTAAERLERLRPDVVGFGEETASAHEGLRLARLAKRLLADVRTVAGGHHFTFTARQSAARPEVDFVVTGEGEETWVDLLRAIRDGRSNFNDVAGIAFKRAERVVETGRRDAISDFDTLAAPAYDLLPVGEYGRASRNHPALASIEHGRGCVDACAFCTLWRFWGRARNGDPADVAPHYRTKGPERAMAEVHRLYDRYGRRTFAWVDPTFNASPAWTREFAARLRAARLDARHIAWMRADRIVEDARTGALENLARSGLAQVMVGVERTDNHDLAALGKHSNSYETSSEAFRILARYPRILTIATVIFGLADDDERAILRLADRAYRLGADYIMFLPLTPYPGTPLYDEARADGRLEIESFRYYNLHTPVLSTRRMSRARLERTYARLMLNASAARAVSWLRTLARPEGRRRRRALASLVGRGTRVAMREIAGRLVDGNSAGPLDYSVRPPWYNS